MDRVLLLFIHNYCINMDEILYVKQEIEDDISYLKFYFKDAPQVLTIANANLKDMYNDMRDQIREQR